MRQALPKHAAIVQMMDDQRVQPVQLSRSALTTLVFFGVICALLLVIGRRDYPNLHTAADTGIFLLSAMLALLLWDMAARVQRPLKAWLAVSFAITAVFELVHVGVTVEWWGSLESVARAASLLRPATWPPAAYLLPLGVGYSLWHLHLGGKRTLQFALTLTIVGAVLLSIFYSLPRYTAPGWFGITRPTLVGVPVLWAIVAYACWRLRTADRILPMLALMAAVLCVANVSMLYSRAPHDSQAMVAHLARLAGYLVLLLFLLQMAAMDMLARIRAEQALAKLNRELEHRVLERTSQLKSTNDLLETEIGVRRQAEQKSLTQLMRLHLLQQITRAIGERQDLPSIFQAVIRRLEENLPIDFGCACSYEPVDQTLTVVSVGKGDNGIASSLIRPQRARIAVIENGLSRCLSGELVHEPDISRSLGPFLRQLAAVGLRSLIVAPLSAENRVFGAFIVARREPENFSSSDCEFLRQLSEHVGLAAHQARLYGSLQEAYDELRDTQRNVMQQERLRVMGQMASGVAHDINNAISPVALYTDLLLDPAAGLNDRARGYLTITKRALEDVAATVGRMREFSRPREDCVAQTRIDLNRIVEQAIELTSVRWSNEVQQRGAVIAVQQELCAEPPVIRGVESEIRDALTNLIFNAVDAMPDGGMLTVRTRSIAQAGMPISVGLEVCDTGVGMDEETRRRCLEPFYTTKGERGTGLGLAMVYGAVQRSDASIDIESAVGKGTTMRILFPTAPADAERSEPQRGAALSTRPLRILVVDDDPIVLEAMLEVLAVSGHLVSVAEGGRAGIQAFLDSQKRGERFEVVITDLGMPHTSGREVAAAVKASSPTTPVILLTGWGQRLSENSEIPPFVDRVLSKPPNLYDLRTALAQLTQPTPKDLPASSSRLS